MLKELKETISKSEWKKRKMSQIENNKKRSFFKSENRNIGIKSNNLSEGKKKYQKVSITAMS